MRKITNWNKYHQRVQFSQIFLPIIWRAYQDLLRDRSFNKPIKIIELGCGTGYHTLQMTKVYSITKVTMVDFNAMVIENTKRRMSQIECEKEFLLCDLFDFNSHEKYDIVHSQGLLEHYTPDQQEKLIRLHRDLLAPDGVALILVPTSNLFYRVYREFQEKLRLWIYDDEIPISKKELAVALELSGLEILKIKNYHLIEIGAACRIAAKINRLVA